ncbi:MAG: enolase [Verrucomicrobia bacterium]|nr:enolase [Verrucomicrobiota bacterium]MBU1909314.1 enolase [Verrucomicrobiota bacterium]
MRIVSAIVYGMDIPFVETFRHSLAARDHSDSVVVKVTTDTGISGFGEGVPRAYVTGETKEKSLEHIQAVLLPAILNADLDGTDVHHALAFVHGILPCEDVSGEVVWHASRCAVELAVTDCLLRANKVSFAAVLPPKIQEITYSGVISAGRTPQVEKLARRLKAIGFQHVKLKVGRPEDEEQVGLVRAIMGPSVSLRLDANGAFAKDAAIRFLSAVARYNVDCIEQPIPRGDPSELAVLRSSVSVPVMADESVVTIRDAEELIAMNACDLFNLRISKCGGLHNTLAMAERAAAAGIGIQLGCQVGETAILSAAGRHVAAHLNGLRFVEGSYGTHMLVEDVAEENVTFGHGGMAPVLAGPGLGITVREEILAKHATAIISVP